MKLQKFYYKCKNCGNTYEQSQLAAYGEFLMRNPKGDAVYLNSFNDPVFDEVEKLFNEKKKSMLNLSLDDEITMFQEIFSVACDKDPDGNPYRIDQKPMCPHCKKVEIGSWGAMEKYVDEEINPVTHVQWNTLTMKQKELLISEAVDQYLSGKNEKRAEMRVQQKKNTGGSMMGK
ncbi:MAG TPA: hypothetical protein VGV92_09325 [Gammaproteobacteria bacterium]|nr:hypothetical protein [Gammaproteobacteria bacterium]